MGIQLADQTLVFLKSLLVGAALGLLYDAFRISRIALPTHKVVVFVEDVLFFFTCALTTFLFFLQTVEGQVRFFLLAGEILGAVLYNFTLGQLVMGVSKTIIRVIKGILGFLFRYLLYPVWRLIYWLVSIIVRPFAFFTKIIKKSVQRFKFRLKVRRLLVYNQCKGFLKRKALGKANRGHGDDDANQKEGT